MKLILGLVLLIPLAASAKSYNSERDVTHDCAKDAEVNINVSAATFKIVGKCKDVSITGSNNKVTIESVEDLDVHGSNTVGATAVDDISASGSKNEISYKQPATKKQTRVKSSGFKNKIERVK